jgi:ferric-dicitrate binding protein FerR (iron transport regulator)
MSTPDVKAAALLRGPSQPLAVPLSRSEETAAIDAVTAALHARKAQVQPKPASISRWPRRLAALAATVLLVAGATWWATRRSPAASALEVSFATISHDTSTALLEAGDGVNAGDRVRTAAEGAATVYFAGGTTLKLGAKTDVGVVEANATRRFLLYEGVVTSSVAKLSAGQRFIIETAVAEVEVRGTEFTVEANPPSATCTAGSTVVSVREGLVRVGSEGREQLVKPGERVTVGCPPPPAMAEKTEAPLEAETPSRPPAPTSSLARMNAAYAKALAFKRQGKLAEAVRELQRLRRTFPAGPLDEAAAVESLRLLEQFDAQAARAAAKRYLAEFPEGYGRDIAERLAAP